MTPRQYRAPTPGWNSGDLMMRRWMLGFGCLAMATQLPPQVQPVRVLERAGRPDLAVSDELLHRAARPFGHCLGRDRNRADGTNALDPAFH